MLWAIFILGICTYPFSHLPSGGWLAHLPMDKLVHFCLFAVLCFLMVRGAARQTGTTKTDMKYTLLILSIALIYGIAIELLQHYCTTKRTGDVWDVAADVLGGLAGLMLFSVSFKKRIQAK